LAEISSSSEAVSLPPYAHAEVLYDPGQPLPSCTFACVSGKVTAVHCAPGPIIILQGIKQHHMLKLTLVIWLSFVKPRMQTNVNQVLHEYEYANPKWIV